MEKTRRAIKEKVDSLGGLKNEDDLNKGVPGVNAD